MRSRPRKEQEQMNSDVSDAADQGIVNNSGEARLNGGTWKVGQASGNKRRSPASVGYDVVEPWPEPVDGAALLDALTRELQRFVVFSK
jgi:hypothetical protein